MVLNENKTHLIIRTFLLKYGIRINSLTIRDILNKNPFKDSIRGVSDTIDELNIPNVTAKIDYQQLRELETPVLGFFNFKKSPVLLIKRATEKEVVLNNSRKDTTLTSATFMQYWSGVVIGIEDNSEVNNDNIVTYYIKEFISFVERNMFATIAILASTLLVISLFYHTYNNAALFACCLIKTAGIVVSAIIIYKTNYNHYLLNSVCKLGKTIDCNSVLQSRVSKMFDWIGLGEISMAYFLGTLLWGIFLTPNPFFGFMLYSCLSMAFVLFSIVRQVWFEKRMCVLCILIDAILIIELATLFTMTCNESKELNILYLLISPLLIALCALVLVLIREYIDSAKKLTHLERKYRNMLTHSNIFNLLISKKQDVLSPDSYQPITNSDSGTKRKILIVTSLNCNKCKEIHKTIEHLGKDLEINIIFAITNDEIENTLYEREVVYKYITEGWGAALNRMSELFEDRRESKTNRDILQSDQISEVMKKHYDYCRLIKLSGTPFITFENKEFPYDIYDVSDIKYLI